MGKRREWPINYLITWCHESYILHNTAAPNGSKLAIGCHSNWVGLTEVQSSYVANWDRGVWSGKSVTIPSNRITLNAACRCILWFHPCEVVESTVLIYVSNVIQTCRGKSTGHHFLHRHSFHCLHNCYYMCGMQNACFNQKSYNCHTIIPEINAQLK